MKKIFKKVIGCSVPFINKISKSTYNGITIFLFHDITDYPSEFNKDYSLATSNKTFEDQIGWINKNFTIIHPNQIIKSDTEIPKNAAIISFDDGFLGTFENGLKILNRLKIPSVIFLNMYGIIEKKPILSAEAAFLSKYSSKFNDFLISNEVKSPFYLSLTPQLMEKARALLAMSSKEKERILNYQGSYANIDELYKWQNSELVVYANHLFNHWNLKSLTKSEIVEEYNKNQEILDSFPNSINLFAFPNGVPDICFTDTELKVIQELGPKKVLSSVNGINRNLDNFLLGRVSFSHTDITPTDFWFRVFRDHTKSHHGQNAY